MDAGNVLTGGMLIVLVVAILVWIAVWLEILK